MKKSQKIIKTVITYVFYAAVFLLFFAPIYWVTITSFKDPGDMFVYPPQWYIPNPTLDHYKKSFSRQ